MTELIEKVQRLMSVARADRDAGDSTTAVELLQRGIDTLERGLSKDAEGMEGPATRPEMPTQERLQYSLLIFTGCSAGFFARRGTISIAP